MAEWAPYLLRPWAAIFRVSLAGVLSGKVKRPDSLVLVERCKPARSLASGTSMAGMAAQVRHSYALWQCPVHPRSVPFEFR